MADRRPPGFNVPLGFYDGPEVKSIPRRIRAAAVGVWTLCGCFSANKLQDGYVGPETLKELGCTDAIRAALKETKGPDGEPDPLWIDARDGGIQFTKWSKYQRSRAEVKAYRDAEAERKRNARKANVRATNTHSHAEVNPIANTNSERKNGEDNPAVNAPTSDDVEMSGRTSAGHPPDHRDPKTKTENYRDSYVHESATESTGRDSIAATTGAELLRAATPSGMHVPAATQTALRIHASEMVKTGTPPDIALEALRDWFTRTGIGPGVLPSLAADIAKRRSGHARAAPNGQPHKLRSLAELTAQERAREHAQLENRTTPKELE